MTDGLPAVPASGPAGSSSGHGASPAALWAEALKALANFVAHDFRNALNGVAVNLEVVRGRSARGAEAAAIAPFAATASTQFETASAAAEALLAFARPETPEPDVAAILARLARLIVLRGDAAIRVNDGTDGRARTPVPGDIVRAVVARSVLSALGAGETVACEIAVSGHIFLHVTGATHVPPLPDPDLVAAASAFGVQLAARGQTLEVRFPAADSRAIPLAPA